MPYIIAIHRCYSHYCEQGQKTHQPPTARIIMYLTLKRNNCMRYKHKKEKTYPKATVATTTFILEEIQSSNTEVRILLFNPA